MKTLSDLIDNIRIADSRILESTGIEKNEKSAWTVVPLDDLRSYTKTTFKEFEKPDNLKSAVKLTKISRVADLAAATLRSQTLACTTRRESLLMRMTQADAYNQDKGYYAKLKNVDKVLGG